MSDTQQNTVTESLENTYVKKYYDNQVGALDGTYTNSRWFSSEARTFDYNQTKRALKKALSGSSYQKVVEVGPGDAVWSEIILESVSGTMHLVEQSEEMYRQAYEKLGSNESVTLERSDFMDANPPSENDLLVSLRCFEYFKDKPGGVAKMFSILKPGGSLVIVTKNSELYTTRNVQNRTVHSDQLSRKEMTTLLTDAGFVVDAVYPATLRWKSKYWIMRLIFDTLHKLTVSTKGAFWIPVLFDKASESHTYIAHRPI